MMSSCTINQFDIGMRIARRLYILTFSAVAGALLFIPFLVAGDPGMNTGRVWIIFPVATGLATALVSWPGLRIADKVNLPMPLLRAWERSGPSDLASVNLRSGIIVAATGGAALSILLVVLARNTHLSTNPGSLFVRLLTIPFGAVVPEIVAHLFLMSSLQLVLKRLWISILLSSAAFVVLFHSSSVGSPAATALVYASNAAAATFTGWLYGRYGFEFAIVGHAAAHGIALGLMGK